MPASIPIPQVKFGKRKERSQMCVLQTKDGRWLDKEYPVGHCIIDESAGMAWDIADDNLYLGEDGNWYQILSEESEIPICPRVPHYLADGEHDDADVINRSNEIFALSFEDKKTEQFLKARQSDMWNRIMWIAAMICATMMAFGAMSYFGGH